MPAQALERTVTLLLEGTCKVLWGFPPNLLEPTVSHLGAGAALRWFLRNMPRYQRTLAAYGEVRTHLLCLAISLVNGCHYCTYGHGYALHLAYLREHDALFPLGELELQRLCGLPPAAIRYDLVAAVQRAGLHADTRHLERVLILKLAEDPQPTDGDDLRLIQLVHMFGVLNSVGVRHQVPADQAHSALNKDVELKRRYNAMRGTGG